VDNTKIKEKLLQNRKITPNDCWEWTRARNKAGYGQITINYKQLGVHQVSAIIFLNFDINSTNKRTNLICHTCDNPPCFNPNHLFISTQSKNREDTFHRNRTSQKGTKNNNHKLIEQEVIEIKDLLKQKNTLISIAKKYKVSFQTISLIKNEKTWKHL